MSSLRWKKFFVEAGLPSEPCENYAVIFSENRIRFDMLDELNKDILYDMGIKKMGDVISILRHAKDVHSSTYRERMFATGEEDGANNAAAAAGSGGEKKQQQQQKQQQSQSQQDKDAAAKYSKADSTIQNDNNNSKAPVVTTMKRKVIPPSTDAAPTTTTDISRRVILPQKAINAAIVERQQQPTVRRTPPVREPVIIRNVTGLQDTISSNNDNKNSTTVTVSRKRIFAPTGDEDEDELEEMGQLPVTKFAKPTVSLVPERNTATTISSNPQVRNRIDAQSRLSNFSKEIQKALSANNNNNNSQLHQQLLLQTPASALLLGSNATLKGRLTLNKADSTTTTVTLDRTKRVPTLKPMPNSISSSNHNNHPKLALPPKRKADVKSRLGNVPTTGGGHLSTGNGIKDRLGLKKTSVFERTGSSNIIGGGGSGSRANPSVFNRLGIK